MPSRFLGFSLFILFSGAIAVESKQESRSFQKEAVCPQPGPYFSIDYLYWKFEQEQLYFVGVGSLASSEKAIAVKGQNFEFDSGFRMGIGYDLPYERYDICLDWTRFRVHERKTYSAPEGQNVLAIDLLGLTAADIAQGQSAEAKWHLNFDMLDLALGSTYLIGKRFALCPMMGLKGGWINQTQVVFYTDVPVDSPAALENCTATLDNDFKGIGPLAGVHVRWGIGSQLGFFSTINSALLYGHFNVQTLLVAPSQMNPSNTNIINSRNGVAPFFQILVGGDWNYCLYDKWTIHFGAAYEMQYWWNIMRAGNNLLSGVDMSYKAGGDLSTHGLTIQTRFDF